MAQAFDYVSGYGGDDTGSQADEYLAIRDTEGFFSSIGHFFSRVGHGIAKGVRAVEHVAQKGLHLITDNPIWKIAETGAAFIPGIGQAVSAGMASAAAIGRGASLKDIALSAARGSLPAEAQVGLDVAVGAIHGHGIHLPHDLAAIRAHLPGGDLAKGAFDAIVALRKGWSRKTQEALAHGLSAPAREAFWKVIHVHQNPPKVNVPRATPVMHAASRAKPAHPGRVRVVSMPRTVRPPNADRPFPSLGAAANRVAAVMLRSPAARAQTPMQLASSVPSTDTRDAQKAIAAFLQRFGATSVFDWRDVGAYDSIDQCARRHGVECPSDLAEWPEETGVLQTMAIPRVPITRAMLHALYRRGDANIQRAILAHGYLAHIARNTGELEGTSWRIQGNGDWPFNVAQQVVGDGNRWKEILAVNPELTLQKNGNIPQWTKGRVIELPPSWFPTMVPVAAPASSSSSTAGGPPFPAPSEYPNGYPSSIYVVRSGDTGEKVAARITGDKDRWRELLVTNPSKKDPKFGIALFTGNQLVLPKSWQAPAPSAAVVVTTQPVLSTPSSTAPAPAPVIVAPPPPSGGVVAPVPPIAVAPPPPMTTPAPATPAAPEPVVQTQPAVVASPEQLGLIETMLAAFYRAHADATWAVAGAPFGGTPEDFAGVWTPRVQAAVQGFQKWWNGKGKAPNLHTDGMPDEDTVNALAAQTKADTPPAVQQTAQQAAASTSPSKSSGDGSALFLLALPFLF